MISNPYDSGCICFRSCSEWEDYTIQEKDTLYNISVRFGVPIRMLMACNRLLNPYNLRVGQVIKVPAVRSEFPGCMGENEESYIIQLRDTLYNIAEKQNTTVERIIEMNPWIDPYNLKPGSRICVPKKPEASTLPASAPGSVSESAEVRVPVQWSSSSGSETSSSYEENRAGENLYSAGNNRDEENTVPADSIPVNAETPHMEKPEETMRQDQTHNVTVYQCDGRFYTVKSDDTLESILDSFDYTYAALAFANPNVDLFSLTQGTKICIPMHDMFRSCNSGTTYIVRSGDSLSSLSERFGVTQSELMSANPFMRSRDFTTAGNRVCIPE